MLGTALTLKTIKSFSLAAVASLVIVHQGLTIVHFHNSSHGSNNVDDGLVFLLGEDYKQIRGHRHDADAVASDPPFVTFVIPSRLNRPSLNQTIESLQRQTVSDWKAIVGVDVVSTRRNNHHDDSLASYSPKDFIRDTRVEYTEVATQSTARGLDNNGSGDVRNQIILQHTNSEWIAFVDDDDTLSPFYVETLQQHIAMETTGLDLVVFRMKRQRKKPGEGLYIPPLNPMHTNNLTSFRDGTLGISFAVRRSVFFDDNNKQPHAFVPGHAEDYQFVKESYEKGFAIGISTCVMYYVRMVPYLYLKRDEACGLANVGAHLTFADIAERMPASQ